MYQELSVCKCALNYSFIRDRYKPCSHLTSDWLTCCRHERETTNERAQFQIQYNSTSVHTDQSRIETQRANR